jgi:hypothetical protein
MNFGNGLDGVQVLQPCNFSITLSKNTGCVSAQVNIVHGYQKKKHSNRTNYGRFFLSRVAYVDSRVQANLIHDCYSCILALLVEL